MKSKILFSVALHTDVSLRNIPPHEWVYAPFVLYGAEPGLLSSQK